MKKQKVTDIFLYRWRYVFGYTLLALLYIGAIIISALHVPGGLSQAEIDMVNTTNHLNFSVEGIAVTNLPFHLLQLLFFKLFGVSLLTIKAPAVILSIASSIAIFFLLKRWFKPSTTILSLLIMATTGQFLFIGQSATVGILYIFYTALTLLFATLILQKAQSASIWRISLAITTALSLFTPYFWYINLGLLIIAFLHPHPRYFLISRKHRKSWIVPSAILFAIGCVIGFLCYKSHALFYNLSGINGLSFDIVANLRTLLHIYPHFPISCREPNHANYGHQRNGANRTRTIPQLPKNLQRPLVYDLVVANLSIGATHLPTKPHPDNHHPAIYSLGGRIGIPNEYVVRTFPAQSIRSRHRTGFYINANYRYGDGWQLPLY